MLIGNESYSAPFGAEEPIMERSDEAVRTKLETQMITYLCYETGITEDQARALIRDLGINKNSLLREAREIRKMKLN